MTSLSNYKCAYARCLSPCRLTTRALQQDSLPHTRCRRQPSLHRYPAAATQPARTISIKLPPTTTMAQTLKTSFQAWSSSRKSKLDVSMLRLIASLNIDLPTFAQHYKPKPAVDKVCIPASSEVKSPTPEGPEPKLSSVENEQHNLHQTRERLKAKLEFEQAPREQHNLADAVEAMGASVDYSGSKSSAMYYSASTVSLPPKLTKDKGTTQVPAGSSENKSVPNMDRKSKSGPLENIKSIIPTNIIPQLPGLSLVTNRKTPEAGVTPGRKAVKEDPVRRQLVAKASIDKRTRELVLTFRKAHSDLSKSVRLEELCQHLLVYPESSNVAVKEQIVPPLLKLEQNCADVTLKELAREVLALVGYVHPVRGRGICILSLDGGGTRGLISIEVLRKIEEVCGKPIQDLFDYICGVSTGSLIAMMTGVFRAPLDECTSLYRECSTEMFNRSRIMGAGKLFTSQAYYDTALWEDILKENIGLQTMLETNRNPKCPKLASCSSLRNEAKTEIFMFRNYNLAPGVQSHYVGSCKYKVWEAIRASSAAPGYYEEKKLDDIYHVDGGVLTNNPTAIAIHESKLLWPTTPLQCVVSVGTGRYESTAQATPTSPYSSLKSKIFQIVQSATDTEGVHTVLQDLLPPQSYFRFNPYMSEDYLLDEVNPQKWEQMIHDTQMYSRKNDHKLKKAAQVLLQPKQTHQKAYDWLKLRKDMIG